MEDRAVAAARRDPTAGARAPALHTWQAMQVRGFLKKLFHDCVEDGIDDVAAMMTYYAIFALFPMLVFVVTFALLVIPSDVIQQGVQMATTAMPRSVGELIAEQVARMQQTADAGFAIGSLTLALLLASRGAASLSSALNVMYSKKERRPWWKRQLIAVGTTLLVSAMIVVALGALVVGPTLGHAAIDRFGLGDTFDIAWAIGRWVGAGLLIMLVWAILYKWLPDTDAPFRVFTPGACVGVALWIGISLLFGVYVDNFGRYEQTYGALGGVIVFLTWLWLSNLALLFGAELNDVVADLRAPHSAAARELARPEVPEPGAAQPTRDETVRATARGVRDRHTPVPGSAR